MSSSQKKQISIHVTVHIAPENVDKFFAAYQPVYDSVIAEPECTFFQVYQDPQNPGTLTWVENWAESFEWFLEVQAKKEYYKEYLAITEKMFIKPREFKALEVLGPHLTYPKLE